jgi:hypothetical protein
MIGPVMVKKWYGSEGSPRIIEIGCTWPQFGSATPFFDNTNFLR